MELTFRTLFRRSEALWWSLLQGGQGELGADYFIYYNVLFP
jgi:hypothetical protein